MKSSARVLATAMGRVSRARDLLYGPSPDDAELLLMELRMLRREARQLDFPEAAELAESAEIAAKASCWEGDARAQGHCEHVLWCLGDLLEHRAYPEQTERDRAP